MSITTSNKIMVNQQQFNCALMVAGLIFKKITINTPFFVCEHDFW